NTSAVAVDLTALTDEWPGKPAFLPTGDCGPLVGTTTLAPAGQPGASVTCHFTLSGYAPPVGSPLTDTIRAPVADHVNPANTASASSDSTVNTPPPVITVTLVKTNDADGDGTFNKSETAPTPGGPVPYHVVFTNTSAIPVSVQSLTDA